MRISRLSIMVDDDREEKIRASRGSWHIPRSMIIRADLVQCWISVMNTYDAMERKSCIDECVVSLAYRV